MKKLALLLSGFAVGLALSACGGSKDSTGGETAYHQPAPSPPARTTSQQGVVEWLQNSQFQASSQFNSAAEREQALKKCNDWIAANPAPQQLVRACRITAQSQPAPRVSGHVEWRQNGVLQNNETFRTEQEKQVALERCRTWLRSPHDSHLIRSCVVPGPGTREGNAISPPPPSPPVARPQPVQPPVVNLERFICGGASFVVRMDNGEAFPPELNAVSGERVEILQPINQQTWFAPEYGRQEIYLKVLFAGAAAGWVPQRALCLGAAG